MPCSLLTNAKNRSAPGRLARGEARGRSATANSRILSSAEVDPCRWGAAPAAIVGRGAFGDGGDNYTRASVDPRSSAAPAASSSTTDGVDVSVLIPVLNEERHLPEAAQRMR